MLAIGFCLATFGAHYAQLREAARHIDDLGFNSIYVWDHYVSWNDPREPVLESWTTLAGLAEATSRVKLGTMVANNTNRHPGRLAKVAATLHELSGGRCHLGIGAGGYEREQAIFGIVQGSATERVARLAEALQIIPALWTGEPITFHGQHYHLDGAIVSPAQNPPPLLFVGASRPGTARLAGRYAAGINMQWRDRAGFPAVLAALDEALAERGRDRTGFDISLHAVWSDLGADPQQMLKQLEGLGITRAVFYIEPPFPLAGIEGLARQMTTIQQG